VIPCFILARKGSKGLKNKNLIKLDNKPLIEYTIEYAKKCKYISHILISTDDIRIVKIAKKHKCIVIYPRPKKLSNDKAKTKPALLHAAKYFINNIGIFDIYAYLQITEPLRPKNILNLCIKKLMDNNKIDSAFAGYEMHKNFWIKDKSTFTRISPLNEINLPR
jgi:CMP-N-acetylneuraminic acid synthetase